MKNPKHPVLSSTRACDGAVARRVGRPRQLVCNRGHPRDPRYVYASGAKCQQCRKLLTARRRLLVALAPYDSWNPNFPQERAKRGRGYWIFVRPQ